MLAFIHYTALFFTLYLHTQPSDYQPYSVSGALGTQTYSPTCNGYEKGHNESCMYCLHFV